MLVAARQIVQISWIDCKESFISCCPLPWNNTAMELQKYTHQHRGQPFDVALLYKNHAGHSTSHSSLDREHCISDPSNKISQWGKNKNISDVLCVLIYMCRWHLAEKIWAVADAMKIPVQENSQKPTLYLTQFALFLWVL